MSVAPTLARAERRTGVNFDEYVRLRDDPRFRGLKMVYHDGVLEIMSPEFRHEKGGSRLHHLVTAYCEAFGVSYEEAGRTTFRKGVPGEPVGDGGEADTSFYLGESARALAGRDTLDPEGDPPPSLWVEVENSTSSLPRLPIYARLGVPEVWRYDVREESLWFGRLVGDRYEQVASSAALPGLTPGLVLDALASGRTMTTDEWSRWLRADWLRAHRQAFLEAGAGG
jgi:Uma2 family endonuclease